MAKLQETKPRPASGGKTAVGRLFVLELNAGQIHSMNTDGTDKKTIVTDGRLPDGIAVDVEAGHIYWTNMGVPSENDGSIERVDLDGQNRTTIVAKGDTFTPKQLHLEKKAGKIYWCDREGMRVMRCDLDGSKIETLVDPSGGDFGRAGMQRNGASELPSTLCAGKSTGRRKVRRRAGWAVCAAPTSTFRRARARQIALTSRCCLISCRSQSISSSI